MTAMTFIKFGDWEMMFIGDDLLEEGHSIDAERAVETAMYIEYDEVHSHRVDGDTMPMYFRENGVSHLFE